MTARSFEDFAGLGRRVAIGELTSAMAAAMADQWHADGVREAEAALGIRHVDGVPWHEAPRPKRWHRCWAQTRGLDAERCPCGAIRMPGVSPVWTERSSRTAGGRRDVTAPRRDPFPDCERLTAAMLDAEAERAKDKPSPEQLDLPYRAFTLSSTWELHADGREFIDGVEVRPPWWRRWLRRRAR